jgi:hypothetical protein
VLCSLAVGATWFCSDAASALDVGPVPVPVEVPPAVTVTVSPDTIGPVQLPVSDLAPDAGASVSVSPDSGADASLSLPSSIGPVALLPGAPHDVQVGIAPDGAGVTLSDGLPSTPGAPAVDSGTQSSSPGGVVESGTAGARTGSRSASLPSSSGAVKAAPAQHRTSDASSLPVESQSGAVTASLEHQSPGGLWSLLHDLASAHGLWIALLLIVAIARFAAGGLLHDAFRRRAQITAP